MEERAEAQKASLGVLHAFDPADLTHHSQMILKAQNHIRPHFVGFCQSPVQAVEDARDT